MTPAQRVMGQTMTLPAGDWTLDSALTRDDVASVAAWLSDRRIAYVLGRVPATLDMRGAAEYMQGFDRIANHLFIIRSRHDGQAKGMAAVRMDGRHLLADFDVIVGAATTRTHDGQKMLAAVGEALAAWVFGKVGIEKLVVRVLRRNRRTAAWADRNLVLEATLRGHVRLPDGSRHDVLQYGLLKSEWASRNGRAVP